MPLPRVVDDALAVPVDCHRRLARGLQPGMVGHGVDQRQRRLRPRMPLDDAAGEGLGRRVGGDETEAAQRDDLALLRFPQQAGGGLVPEMHDEIGAAGNFRPGLPARLGIAVAELDAHVLAADERRVAHDEFGFRPFRGARVLVAVLLHRGVGIGDFLAGDRVQLHGEAVPAAERLAVLVPQQFLLVESQDRVLLPDRAVGLQHRLGDAPGGYGAELPLQIADPQHEVGDGDGAGVDFETVELARADGLSLHDETRRVLAQVPPSASSTSPSSRFISSSET